MDYKVFSLALLQLTISLILAVLMAYATFKIFRYVLTRKYKIELDNIAFAILTSAILYAVGSIVSGVIKPMLNLIRTLDENAKTTLDYIWNSMQYSMLFIGLGFLVSFIVTITGLYLFTFLTRTINEFEEISKDNRAVGLITGVIIIVIALFVKDSVDLLLESLIPYPDFPIRNG